MVVKGYGNHGYEKELEKNVMVNLGKKTLIEVEAALKSLTDCHMAKSSFLYCVAFELWLMPTPR